MTLTASYQWTFRELLVATRLHQRRWSLRLLRATLFFAGIVFVLLGVSMLSRHGDSALFGVWFVLIGLLGITVRWIERVFLYRHFRRRPDCGIVVTTAFSEEDVQRSYSLGSSQSLWASFARARANEGYCST